MFTDTDKAWQATMAAFQEMQLSVISEDKEKGIIKAEDNDGNNISAQILHIESRPVSIDITVRKKGLPNLKLADSIVDAINKKFREL